LVKKSKVDNAPVEETESAETVYDLAEKMVVGEQAYVIKKIPIDKEEAVVPEGLSKFLDRYTAAELKERYDTEMAKLKGKVAEASLVAFTISAVINEIRKDVKRATFVPKAEASPVVGIIVADTGLWDKIGNMISAAQAYVKRTSIAVAVRDQYINGDGQVLDRRQKLFGKPNPDYLKPLKEKVVDSSRTLGLIGRIDESQVFKYGTIQTNDGALARGWNKIKFFTPCQTFGIVKDNPDDGFFKLNSSQAEGTTSIFKAVKEDMDVDAIFHQVVDPQLTAITAVERTYELIKEAYDRTLFVKGTVAWIARDRPNNWGAIRMGLMDDDGNEIVVSIPEYLSKDFGELSKLIVIGKPDRGDLKVVDDETKKTTWEKKKGDVYLQALGIYVSERTPEDVYSADALGETAQIEGWIP
jgi:hypothetical protein